MVQKPKTIVLSCLFVSLLACQTTPLPTHIQQTNESNAMSDETNKLPITLTLNLLSENDEPITLSKGSTMEIYKENKLLISTSTLDNNEIKLNHLKEPPPYQYKIVKGIIEDIQFSRLIPVGTQGGLVTLPPTETINVPGNISTTPTPPPSSPKLQPKDIISFEGTISEDLQQDQTLTLEQIKINYSHKK